MNAKEMHEVASDKVWLEHSFQMAVEVPSHSVNVPYKVKRQVKQDSRQAQFHAKSRESTLIYNTIGKRNTKLGGGN